MSRPDQAVVSVDVLNPGHVFACCGLLEMASRLWPDVEGWFEAAPACFVMRAPETLRIDELIKQLKHTTIESLTQSERDELAQLRHAKKARDLTPQETSRLQELERTEREGSLIVQGPFSIRLDWWQEDGTPTTWAGQQRVGSIAQAAQRSLPEDDDARDPLNYACVLRTDGGNRKTTQKVEPFYFDARRLANALDVGFSLDEIGGEVAAYPAVELLCLIGLQRYRPALVNGRRYRYTLWYDPLGVCVSAGVISGSVPIPGGRMFEFGRPYRDRQGRYKAFGFARPC